MVTTKYSDGTTLDFTAAAALTSGQGLLVGTQFVVVAETYASGAEAVGIVVGVFDLPVASADNVAIGDSLYWSGTEFTKTASGNVYCGKAWSAAGVGVANAYVKINPGGAAAASA
ncbi:MAG: DUF2190 family protein [Planctomycetota bacterium]